MAELYGGGKGLCKIGSMFQILASLPGGFTLAILIIGNFGKVARQPVFTFETDACTCDPPSFLVVIGKQLLAKVSPNSDLTAAQMLCEKSCFWTKQQQRVKNIRKMQEHFS